MSLLRVYLNWVNSVLSDTGKQIDGLADIQSGEVICQLLDILSPGKQLHVVNSQQGEIGSSTTPYLEKAFTFLQKQGIKSNCTIEDINQGDVKAVLDLLWSLILNFTIHSPRRKLEKRTIRNGKRLTLKWCQKQQPLAEWDIQKTVTNNLCSGDNFIKLLEAFSKGPFSKTEDKEKRIFDLLEEIERRFKIKSDIIKPKDILNGLVEDHDLLIYLSLLRWRVGDTVDTFSSEEENNSGFLTDQFTGSKRGGSLSRLDNLMTQQNSLSHMLHSLANEDGYNPEYLQKMAAKNVTFTQDLDNKGSSGHRSALRLSRPNSAPSSRPSANESKATNSLKPGQFSRSFSPSRYAKSFEIPPGKKEELQNRTEKINGSLSKIVATPPTGEILESNSLSENTSDWLSCDMDSANNSAFYRTFESNDSIGPLYDSINLKAREVIPACNGEISDMNSSTNDKSLSNKTNFQSSHSGGLPNPSTQGNVRVPVGGVPMFGMTSGVPIMSGVGSGVPLFLLPGHNPQVIQLLQGLQQQQQACQSIGDTADSSQLELSGQTSGADYTYDYSNLADETSLSESSGKFEKRHSVDSSEAELKQLDCGSPKENNPYLSSHQSSQRMTDSGCESQTKWDYYDEDESLKKIKLLRGNLQKPLEEQKSPIKETVATSNAGATSSDPLSRRRPYSASPSRSSVNLSEETKQKSRKSCSSPEDGRYFNRDTQLDKELVSHLSDELKYLKSKVLTLEKSQENSKTEPPSFSDDSSRFERGRPPKGMPRRSPSSSPPRSLLYSSDYNPLSSTEASKRARETVSNLLVTMQSPVSRSQRDVTNVHERPRRTLPSRPLYGFGRSQSEDRLHGKSLRYDTDGHRNDWGSRSFNGSTERRAERDPMDSRLRSLQDLSSKGIKTGILTDEELIVRPPAPVSINYGYSSPIQKVSADIWGMDLNDLANLEPGRQEKWKRLTEPKKFMTDSEVIELKQCLASATMENEILHAKVGNANLEIGEKMTKIAQVLEETKLSLIKTQSENETLRTQLDREKEKSSTLEVRVTDLESILNKVKSERERLENELHEVKTLLGATNADGIHIVEQENYRLKRQLHLAKEEQKKNKQDLENLKVSRSRAHSAVKDLHDKLEDTREENVFLNREIDEVKNQERSYRKTATLLSRAEEIKNQLIDREDSKLSLLDPELRQDRQYPLSSTPARHYSSSTPMSKLKSAEPLMSSSPSRGLFIPRAASPTDISPVKSYPSRPVKYNYEEISPAGPYKDIYPHRRPKSAGLIRTDSEKSEKRRKWSLTGQLNFSDCDLGESHTEKQYEDRLENRPPHHDLRETSFLRSAKKPDHQRYNYRDEIERLKSHLSQSYQEHDRQRSRYNQNSSLPVFDSDQNRSYIDKNPPDFDRDINSYRDKSYKDFTPQNSSRVMSPSRCHAPVRGILKPSCSDQDLRRIGRSSPPSRRSASPNVTFNTEVSSRPISPMGATREMSRFRDSHQSGIPLFGVPSRRYGVVRNLNDEFEDEEPVRDTGSGFRTKSSWTESKNSCDVPLLTSDRRHYADLLIDKYLYRRPLY